MGPRAQGRSFIPGFKTATSADDADCTNTYRVTRNRANARGGIMRRFVVYLRGHTLVALTIAFLALWLIGEAGAAEGETAEATEAPEAP